MNDSRTSLRKELLNARSRLSDSAQKSAALTIASLVVDSVHDFDVKSPATVASYLAHGGEVNAMPAAEALRALGWTVVLPVCGSPVRGNEASMEFCPWSPGDHLNPNRYGIDEPVSEPVPISSIDVVLVPGVGFDKNGSRIGHGVGFYDRFFARCHAADHEPIRLALAHDLQIVTLPPPQDWDVPMHRILTPTKVIDRT